MARRPPRPDHGESSRRPARSRSPRRYIWTMSAASVTPRRWCLRSTGVRNASCSATAAPASSRWPPNFGRRARRLSSPIVHLAWTSAGAPRKRFRKATTASSSPRARWSWESTWEISTGWVQMDAPATVASFMQRLGRTGRRPATTRNCLFLATTDDGFLRASGSAAPLARRLRRAGRPATGTVSHLRAADHGARPPGGAHRPRNVA